MARPFSHVNVRQIWRARYAPSSPLLPLRPRNRRSCPSRDGANLPTESAPAAYRAISVSWQKLAVQSGAWPLYRFNPAKAAEGKNPLSIDSKAPTVSLEEDAYNETRYRMLLQSDESRAELLMKQAKNDVRGRWDLYRQMAAMHYEPIVVIDGGDDEETE